MKLVIEMELDNAAFEDNHGGEMSRILRKFASKVEDHPTLCPPFEWALLDHNGNRVGKARIE